MSAPNASEELEGVLRQIVALRAEGGSPASIDAMVEAAHDLWSDVPPPAVGQSIAWPSDIAALAEELGFATGEPHAGDHLEGLAAQIDKAIVAVGGIGNVRVSCSPDRIVITGIAGDEDARDEALIAAAKLAPGMQIEDAIDVA